MCFGGGFGGIWIRDASTSLSIEKDRLITKGRLMPSLGFIKREGLEEIWAQKHIPSQCMLSDCCFSSVWWHGKLSSIETSLLTEDELFISCMHGLYHADTMLVFARNKTNDTKTNTFLITLL